VQEDDTWREQVLETNRAHHSLRLRLTEGRADELAYVRKTLGNATVENVMGHGLDQPRGSTKLRCLHAHAAEELVRGRSLIGKQVLQDLKERGTAVDGTADCCDYCNMCMPLGNTSWDFVSRKKVLRKLKDRQSKQEAACGACDC